MAQIWFSADLHFNHNREFVYKLRGFDSVEEMNEAIVERFNKTISSDDTLYILGDLCLGGGSEEMLEENKRLISSLNGHLKIVLGNHDTNNRIKMYSEGKNVEVIGYADLIKYNGYHFYLSHYPTITTNLDDSKSLKQRVLNLYGHTHQKASFYNDNPTMYHVGVDSHNCYPILFDSIIERMKEKVEECIVYL